MKLLITGGSGFIGKHLCDILGKQNNIYVLGTQKNINQIKSHSGMSFSYYYSDYSYDSLENLINVIKPEAVIHLAAHRPVRNEERINTYIENLRISSNLFEVCLNNSIYNIVNISSRLIYSQQNPLPWIEDCMILPNGYYSLSKYWVEITAGLFNNKGLNIKTLRIAQVIGKGEREGYALQIYIKNAEAGLPIIVFGKCEGKRHYVYVNDVVSAINAAILKTELKGVYNIGMESVYGFDELAQITNKVFGNKSEIVFDKEAKADENIYQMSVVKAKNDLNWKPQYNLEEALIDMVKQGH